MSIEYRVVIKRVGCRPKYRKFVRRHAVDRLLVLLGPEPWKAWEPDAEGDDLECCGGYQCGCNGMTYAEHSAEVRKDMAPIESITIEQREVGSWGPTP